MLAQPISVERRWRAVQVLAARPEQATAVLEAARRVLLYAPVGEPVEVSA